MLRPGPLPPDGVCRSCFGVRRRGRGHPTVSRRRPPSAKAGGDDSVGSDSLPMGTSWAWSPQAPAPADCGDELSSCASVLHRPGGGGVWVSQMLPDLGALDGGALCYGSAGAGPLDSGRRPHPLDLRMPLRRGELRSWFLTRCQERSQPRKNRGGGLGCFGRFCFGASCKGPPHKNGRVQKSKRELNLTTGFLEFPTF